MALKIHPEGSKGLYKDNLSGVVGVKVEIRKEKEDQDNWVAGVKAEVKKKQRFFFKIHGRTRFEDNYNNRSLATAPEMLVGIS